MDDPFLWMLLAAAAKSAEIISQFAIENDTGCVRILARRNSVQFPAAQPAGGLRMKLPSVITPVILRPIPMLLPTTPTYQGINTVGLLMIRAIIYHLLRRQLAVGDESEAGSVAESSENVNMQEIDDRETIQRSSASNVLISGLQGLGAEIAKNLILSGVSVTLHDEFAVELWDLSSNFCFSEKDIGKNRAVVAVQKLQELNNDVLVSTLSKKLTKEQLSDFKAVVFTDIDLKTASEFDDYCHSHQPPIAFIKTEVRGLFGGIFCDFGPEFTVVDVGCEEPHTGFNIASISNSNPALVTCCYHKRPEFKDGDLVTFSKIQGMTELNDGKPRKVISCSSFTFYLEEDTSNFGTYAEGGIVTQVKQPKVLRFKPLREALKTPGEFLPSDFSKLDHPPLLHLAFQALDKFVSDLGRFPVAGSEDDAQTLISIATTMNESLGDRKLDDLNPKLLRFFAFGARAVLNPMAAMFGGIVGQEVVKAFSGKFYPIFQFYYFDSVESLPTEPLEPSEYKPLNSRYDAQVSVFGANFQNKLENTKSFVVGSGALGCEFLKNLALMGVGKLIVTDNAVIEESNLRQQFLFRDWNIGQSKSTVAASAAALINPSLQVEALQNRVGLLERQNVFDATFWENLNVVIHASYNVNTRLYVDKLCSDFQKPLLQPGTPGSKCNTKMVIPHLTENYGASRDPPEKQAAMCTVQSFPHKIDHCMTWARSEFEVLFVKTPADVNAYLSDEYTPAGDAQAQDYLERVLECLEVRKCGTFQDCIAWARLKFEEYFSNQIKQLVLTFPEDATTSTGASFWAAPLRFPRPLVFSVSDPTHVNFVLVGSFLCAEALGIPIPDWAENPEKLAEEVNLVNVPDFQPNQGVRFETDGNATSLSSASMDDGAAIEKLIKNIEQCRKRILSGYFMKPVQFEEDDATDCHLDFIVGLANMRARNYSIPEVNKLSAKLIIARRIIPAIATGLVCLELYKVIDGSHKVVDRHT